MMEHCGVRLRRVAHRARWLRGEQEMQELAGEFRALSLLDEARFIVRAGIASGLDAALSLLKTRSER